MKKRDSAQEQGLELSSEQVWEQAARELLRALRGKRSQTALSRRLGYKSRPVADWEAGRRFPTAAVMLRVCALTGVDVAGAFAAFHPPSAQALGDGSDTGVANWLSELRGETPIQEIAARADLPRFSVSRWLRGINRPRLPQFLALVEALTGRASGLVASLVDIHLVTSLEESHRVAVTAKRLAFDEPFSAAILRVLETRSYAELEAHQPGWIAQQLGIDRSLEERCLRRLSEARMVRVDAHTRKYLCVPSTVDTHASPSEMVRLKQHWAEVASERMQVGNEDDLFSFNLISVSDDDLVAIRQLLRSTFREIRSLVAASSPVERVALVQLHLATFGEAANGAARGGDRFFDPLAEGSLP